MKNIILLTADSYKKIDHFIYINKNNHENLMAAMCINPDIILKLNKI